VRREPSWPRGGQSSAHGDPRSAVTGAHDLEWWRPFGSWSPRCAPGTDLDPAAVSGDQTRLSAESELTVYRVAQEALSNVVRHAQATHTRVNCISVTRSCSRSPTTAAASLPPASRRRAPRPPGTDLDAREGIPDRRQSDVHPRKPHGTRFRPRSGFTPDPPPVADALVNRVCLRTV
jgi:hypothetical protein